MSFVHFDLQFSHLNETFPSVLPGSDLIPPGACNLLNSSTIYANNEVNMSEVDIYGFDYDYTLALYSNALNAMIYNKAKEFLIEHFKVCFASVALSVFALQLLSKFNLLARLFDSTPRASSSMTIFLTSLSGVFTMTSRR